MLPVIKLLVMHILKHYKLFLSLLFHCPVGMLALTFNNLLIYFKLVPLYLVILYVFISLRCNIVVFCHL
uniref:Uncharacterized protein n=1 Tax=Aegilops tauschii subsp. strangulata TaxID=200361 RepID=A0A453GGK9_AEGTS